MPELSIRISDEALTDLDDIWFYVAQDKPETADNHIDRIQDAFELIAANPEMGRRRPELSPGLQSFVVRGYIIYYLAGPSELQVVRVLSGRRDPLAVL